MAYQIASLPDIGTVQEVLDGIIQETPSAADRLCRRVGDNKTALSGKIAIRGTTWTVTRGENRNLAPLEEANDYEADISFVQYNAGAYVGTSLLSDEERNDANAIADLDAYAQSLETARHDANTGLARDLAAVLKDTTATVNQSFNVTSAGNGVWDASGAEMDTDLRTVREVTVPGADMIVIGRGARQTMIKNDQFLASELGGNQYADGSGRYGALTQWLRDYTGFSRVEYFDTLYNSAALAADPTLAYIFDNDIWVGYSDDLVLVHPNSPIQDTQEANRITSKRAWKLQYSRYDAIIRGSAAKGVVLTDFQT